MSRNQSFEDLSGSYVCLFRITGLLPFKGKNSNYLATRILFVYFIFMNVLFCSPFVFSSLNEAEFHIDTTCETILVLSGSIRYYLLIWKRKKVQDLLERMEEIWSTCSERGQQIVSTFERRMRRLQYCYLCIISTVNILYPINALFIRLPPLEPNGIERRSLPYKWYVKNAEDLWPGYWWTFAFQVLVVQTSIIYFYLVGTVLSGFIMILSGYFSYLRHDILRTADDFTDSIAPIWRYDDREILRLIKFHQKLLILSADMEKIATTVFLVQVATTCYNVSLIGFKLSSSDPDRSKYLSIFLGSVFQLFMCQWAPGCLFDESRKVGFAAFSASTTWMKRRSHGKLLLLMILRAQRPAQITAGGFVILSLETFGSMMSSAYTFFTMLRGFDL